MMNPILIEGYNTHDPKVKRVFVAYEYKGRKCVVEVAHSSLADKVEHYLDPGDADILAITFGRKMRLSPKSTEWTLERLAAVICHEWAHGYHEDKYGIVGAWLMYIPRVLFHGNGFSHSMEKACVDFTMWPQKDGRWKAFLPVAKVLRDKYGF